MILLLLVFAKFSKRTVGVSQETLRRVKFNELSLAQEEHFVASNDGIESVGNGKNSCIGEFLLDYAFNGLLGHDINVSGRFVKHYELAVA